MSKYFITTPIYYVNDVPHLGHAYTTLAADVLARWHRAQGDEVFFLTGTDEHGAKVQQAAEAKNISPQEFADQTAEKFKLAWRDMNLSNDYFIRTSDPAHENVVQDFLQKIYSAGYIYQGQYEGLYCIGCEKFLQSGDLVNGKCPLHPNQEPVQQKESNYFFKLSAFRDKLLVALESKAYKIIPEGRHNEIVGKLKQGLEDISISRAGVSWGVPVPWDKNQTIYVWVDALINYYSATKIVDGKENYWPAQVHLLGKDILWFHAVIWEALLMAAGLSLPQQVAAHGFFTIAGQKMSKSLGNVIAPSELVNKFGVDATRYLIMADIPFEGDGDVSWGRFAERYQSDLANGIGNTLSRVTNMIEKFGNGTFAAGETMNKYSAEINSGVFNALKLYKFDVALTTMMEIVRSIDSEIEKTKPWQMAKEGRVNQIQALLDKWGTQLLDFAKLLVAFMPETATAIEKILRADKITKTDPLFPRLVKN